MNDQERLEQKKVKSTEALTKAVLSLQKRFKQNEDIAKKSGLLGEKNIFKKILNEKKDKIKEAFSLKGITSMMGLGPDSIIGQLIDFRHEKKKEKAAEVSKAREYAANFAKYDPKGQELAKKSQEEAIKEGTKLYIEQKEVLESIAKIEKEISDAKELGQGDLVAEAKKGELSQLQRRKMQLQTPSLAVATPGAWSPTTKKQDPIEVLREQLLKKGDVIKQAREELETKEGRKLTKSESSAFSKGIREGMDEELLKLNEEQLNALRKLVENTEVSAEDKLEGKVKKPGGNLVEKEVKETAKGGGLLGNLFKGFSVLKDILKATPLGRLAAGAFGAGKAIIGGARALGSGAISVGKAIGSGVMNAGRAIGSGVTKLGGMVSDLPIFNSASKIAGKEGVQVAGKTIAKEGAKELGKTGAKSLGKSLLKKIPGIGLLAGVGFGISRLMSGDYLGAAGEVASGVASTIPGIGTAASIGIDAALAGRDISNEMSKVETTDREIAGQELQEGISQSEQLQKGKAGAASAAPTTIVNNNVVNNNAKTVKLSSPPVRNVEPSYNNRLYSSIATIGIRG